MSSYFPQQILGDPAGRIHHRFFQVFTHALLFHFNAIFIKFHGQLRFLGQTKKGTTAHMEIEVFSAYRAGHMQKNLTKLRTYTAILKKVTYVAANKDF